MNKKLILLTIITACWVMSWNSRAQGQAEQAGTNPLHTEQNEWVSLFDGKTLTGWKVLQYGGNGKPSVRNESMILPRATDGPMTGVCWVGDPLPSMNYIITYEARRVAGGDIFAALTFPYGDTSATLIFGGWYGLVNGLSCINGFDASQNETTQYFSYNNNQWYSIELRVTTDSIRAMVGKEKVVDIATAGKDIHVRDSSLDTGFTLWNYNSAGEIRNVRIKQLP